MFFLVLKPEITMKHSKERSLIGKIGKRYGATKMVTKVKECAFLLFLVSGLALAEESLELGTAIGIDLGTTYSRMGVYSNGYLDIIPNEQGNRAIPSWVAFTDTETLIGEAAMYQAALNPERTIFGVRRLIGRKFDDPEVKRDMKLLPYKVVNKDGKPCIQVKVKDGEIKLFSPEEITAMILRKMKDMAQVYLRKKIKDVVITVPAYFSYAQRQATEDAGIIAGFNVVRIMKEHRAAAMAYGFVEDKGEYRNILVYDLGGSTFDVSILDFDDGVLESLSESGDTHLGGQEFDERVVEYFVKLIKMKYKTDISKDDKALGKLRRECERAKRVLSSQRQVQVEIQSVVFDDEDDDGISNKNFFSSEPLSREKFEELNMDLFNKTIESVYEAVEKFGLYVGLNKTDIHEILLVGGSSRIPKVQQLLKDVFDGKEPSNNGGVNLGEAVAQGAAIEAAIITREMNYSLLDTGIPWIDEQNLINWGPHLPVLTLPFKVCGSGPSLASKISYNFCFE